MRSPYSKARGRRPCAGKLSSPEASARLFNCGRCRVQVRVCSCCDRGQIYCARGCANETRRRSMREAGRRYQQTTRGRLNHAVRQRRYRQKRLIAPRVTTVSAQSAAPAAYAMARAIPSRDHGQCLRREVQRETKHANWRARLVRTERSDIWRQKKKVTHQGFLPWPTNDFVPADTAAMRLSHCHWCGRLCSPFVRNGFLRR
jgi:hypothetical protein